VTELARLHPEDKQDIARRVIEGLIDIAHDLPALHTSPPPFEAFDATAEDIAQRCGVKAAWVREHAPELGGVRIGSGTKPRHRFSIAIATERIAAMRSDIGARPAKPTRKERQRPPHRAPESEVPLLPIKGRMPT
jgi:hypothetical protein